MLFSELRFLPFFLIVFSVHWALRSNRSRKVWLLLASYFFYGCWDWRFLSLILFSTAVDYVVGVQLSRPETRKKFWLGVSLTANLGLLGFFKYFGFFVDSAVELLQRVGFQAHEPTLSIILPVGISFYTFQTLSYSIDVYMGRLEAVHDPLDLAFFVAFFPQLVAGPIVRAVDFLPQVAEKRYFSRVDVRGALLLFLVGYIKKACISDNLAPYVDAYFATPEAYTAFASWTATLFYSVQLYCDFSGYSDMAIACAALLGYRLILNFHFPYFSRSIAEFWRRWHISLSAWIRDYLYIALGGNRGGRLRMYRNLVIALVLCGFWHGAAWRFIFFGAIQAAALIARIEWNTRVPEDSFAKRVVDSIAMPLTFVFFIASLIVFRTGGWDHTWTALRSFLLFESPGSKDFGTTVLWLFPIFVGLHWLSYRRVFAGFWRRLPDSAFALAIGAAFAMVQPFVAIHAEPFIYFQF
ncbi:MAG TPA: MBOAT family protein [Planctomycetes bacterium]|nr:MBOAT family protein [Planctomycetota bacterium]